MGEDSVPVYVFRLGERIDADELERLADAIQESSKRAGLDAEFIFLNSEVEPIDKQELLSALCDDE